MVHNGRMCSNISEGFKLFFLSLLAKLVLATRAVDLSLEKTK